MKKLFQLITNWKYTWFAWTITVFYRWRASEKMRNVGAIFVVAVSVIGALLMAGGKWWGAVVGALFGVQGIVSHYYNVYTGGFIKIDGRPLSLFIIAIYVFMGWMCYIENGRSTDK